jgi:PAS domain S-box-containing protein
MTAKGKVKRSGTGGSFIKAITFSYLLATGLLAVLAVGSYGVLHELTKAEASSAAQINVSGRQRMLSQRIAMLGNELIESSEYAYQPDRAEAARQGMLDAVDLMEQSHQGLIQGDAAMNLPGNPPAKVRAMYFDGPQSLDAQLGKYVADARALARAPVAELTHANAHIRYINAAAAGDLLAALDVVVKQYQKESEADIVGLQRLQLAIIGITLVVLLLLVLFIFRPMVRRIRRETGALKSAETRLRTVIEGAPDAIITIDEEGIIRSFNPAAEKIFGYGAAEAIGNNVNMLIPEPYHSEHDAYIQRYLQTGQARIIGRPRELTAKRRDGSAFPIELVISEMRTNGERMFIGLLSDITWRKRLDKALRDSEDLHRTTLSNMSEAVFITDDDGAFTFVCINTETIFGYSREEVKEMVSIDRLLGGEPVGRKALAAAGGLKNIDWTIRTRDGRRRCLLISVKRVNIQGGTSLYTCRDVTELKLTEEKLKANMAKLRQMNELMMGREYRTMELKGEINELLKELGREDKYAVTRPPKP